MRNILTFAPGFKEAGLLSLVALFSAFSSIDAAECPEVKNKEEFMFKVDSMCYHYIEKPDIQVTFDIAQPDCVSRGGNLVTIKDNKTHAEVTSVLQSEFDSHTVLIGLRKNGDSWKWVTGESLSYTNWERSSGCQTCDCAKLKLRSEGVWEMFSCQATDWFTAYVCEYEPNSSNSGSSNKMYPATWSFLSVLSTFTAAMIMMLCH